MTLNQAVAKLVALPMGQVKEIKDIKVGDHFFHIKLRKILDNPLPLPGGPFGHITTVNGKISIRFMSIVPDPRVYYVIQKMTDGSGKIQLTIDLGENRLGWLSELVKESTPEGILKKLQAAEKQLCGDEGDEVRFIVAKIAYKLN